MEAVLIKVKPLVSERIYAFSELKEWIDYIVNENIPDYEASLLFKRSVDVKTILERCITLTQAKTILTQEFWKFELKKLSVELGSRVGDVLWPIRVAISGKEVALPLYESLELVPRDVLHKRFQGALDKC